jgi:hypothetical protein
MLIPINSIKHHWYSPSPCHMSVARDMCLGHFTGFADLFLVSLRLGLKIHDPHFGYNPQSLIHIQLLYIYTYCNDKCVEYTVYIYIYILYYILYTWLVVYLPLRKKWISWDGYSQYGKKMFQATNQIQQGCRQSGVAFFHANPVKSLAKRKWSPWILSGKLT